MARYRKLEPRFFDDEKVRRLHPEAKLVALYMIAQSNRCGLYVFSIPRAADDLGLDVDTCRTRVSDVLKTLGWHLDHTSRVLWIPSWWKSNPPENPSVMVGVLSDLDDLPQTYLLREFVANTRYFSGRILDAFMARVPHVPDTCPTRVPHQEQEQEQEQEQDLTPFPAVAGGGGEAGPKPPEAKPEPRRPRRPNDSPPTLSANPLVAAFQAGYQAAFGALPAIAAAPGGFGGFARTIGDLARAKGLDPAGMRRVTDAFCSVRAEWVVGTGHSAATFAKNFERWHRLAFGGVEAAEPETALDRAKRGADRMMGLCEPRLERVEVVSDGIEGPF